MAAAAEKGLLDAESQETRLCSYPFGTHVAVVEVDVETGHVRLDRMITCDDAGRIINPVIVEGQRHGGIAQGVAQALMEEVSYDADGNPQTTNFADYASSRWPSCRSSNWSRSRRRRPTTPSG